MTLRVLMLFCCAAILVSCGRNPEEKSIDKGIVDPSTDVISPPGAPRGDVIQNGEDYRPSLSLDLDTEIELKIFKGEIHPKAQKHIKRQSQIEGDGFYVHSSACPFLRPEECI